MKKLLLFLLILTMVVALCACGKTNTGTSESESEKTEENINSEENDLSEENTTQEEEHSVLYNENYTVEQVIEYFNEVALGAEYTKGEGDTQVIQKWAEEISYRIYGLATQEDWEVLEALFDQLNSIEGFPGIYPAIEDEMANLTIHFYNYDDFCANMGETINYEEADGAVEYWYYDDTNDIYKARIGYRIDIDQNTRNSVLLEEVVNGLGLNDSALREDSIVYQGFSETQELSDMDWIIIKLLYSPEIRYGMNQQECREVIERLYY